MNHLPYECIKIRNYIYHIADVDHVYCTLIIGEKLAILVDTGFGYSSLREYVESIIKTDYIVINTHGHPDHILGDWRFDSVYMTPADISITDYYTSTESLQLVLNRELKSVGFSKEETLAYLEQKQIHLKPVQIGTIFDLGNLHIEIVDLKGHTSGSIGLLLKEDRLLIAGDALNTYLWLFFEESTSIKEYIKTLEYANTLPFDTYLSSHSKKELPKSTYQPHLQNATHLKMEEETKETILGYETYCSILKNESGISHIVYSKTQLE